MCPRTTIPLTIVSLSTLSMRITIVTGPFHPTPPGPSGAVERRWYYVAREFARKGHDVTFISKRAPSLPASEVVDGVQHFRHTNFKATRFLTINLLYDLIYAIRSMRRLPRADILVTNDFTLPVFAKWVVPFAGRISMNVARVPKGQLFLYQGATRLVGVSSMIRDEIVRQTPSLAARAHFIPNPIDTSIFNQEPGENVLTSSEPEIVYTGRVHREKGLDTLIKAHRLLWKEFPDLRLRIIGPWRVESGGGGEKFLKQLKKLAGDAPVEFTDAIYDRAQLATAIRRGRYYCYPSVAERGEAFPCAPLEAMGCGRVPIVSKLLQFRDYIRDGENGVYFDHTAVDPVKALADTMRRLIVDPALTQRLASQAAIDATHYSFDRIADLYLQDFSEMLGQSGPATAKAAAAVVSTDPIAPVR